MNEQEQELIRKYVRKDVRQLALLLAKQTDVDRNFVLTQVSGMQAIEKKIPSWYGRFSLLFPPHLSMEQCSSELTARYKASLVRGERFTDLTGGFGVDCAFMSVNFSEAVYVEQQELLCDLAQHNFKTLKLNHIKIINVDTHQIIATMDRQSWVYIDPARRSDSGNKTFLLEDCHPDMTKIYGAILEKTDHLMVKLSPMLDISLALAGMPQTNAIYVVAVDNECKELLFIIDKEHSTMANIHCINLHEYRQAQNFIFTREQESNATPEIATTVGQYLYEPNSAILKAGAFKLVAVRFGLEKLHLQSHLYTANHHSEAFPGRVFKVDDVYGTSKGEIKRLQAAVKKANIATRNFPESVDRLRKKLNIADGGEHFLFATTNTKGNHIIIRCRKADQLSDSQSDVG